VQPAKLPKPQQACGTEAGEATEAHDCRRPRIGKRRAVSLPRLRGVKLVVSDAHEVSRPPSARCSTPPGNAAACISCAMRWPMPARAGGASSHAWLSSVNAVPTAVTPLKATRSRTAEIRSVPCGPRRYQQSVFASPSVALKVRSMWHPDRLAQAFAWFWCAALLGYIMVTSHEPSRAYALRLVQRLRSSGPVVALSLFYDLLKRRRCCDLGVCHG